MLLVCGTVPVDDMPLVCGPAKLDGDILLVDGNRIPCGQGTAAMISAACAATEHMGIGSPHALLAGDSGDGVGSREIYRHLTKRISEIEPSVLCLHYLLPIKTLMRKLVSSLERCGERPALVADAGSMYAAKAAGLAPKFDVFTPDPAELAFLADPKAFHPSYISEHLFERAGGDATKLIEDAYRHQSAAKLLLVKGKSDHIAYEGEVRAVVDEPCIPEMEAIGGTGDTITGLVAAFIHAGLEPTEAALIAAKANRVAGEYAGATVATRVTELIAQFKAVFADHLCEWSGACIAKEGKR